MHRRKVRGDNVTANNSNGHMMRATFSNGHYFWKALTIIDQHIIANDLRQIPHVKVQEKASATDRRRRMQG
jgi:hypothetical protein